MQTHRLQQVRETALARLEAREIQRSHPAIFRQLPVPVVDLAHALGLRVEKRPELHQRARLEILEGAQGEPPVIAVRTSLSYNASRFAVAHEIGHAVLLSKHPQVARQWMTDQRETFANVFATELLASPDVRLALAETFRALSDPLALLRLASRVGFSPHALLTLASQEPRWTKDLNKIWLRIKFAENRFTRQEPKLRIMSAHYDHRQLYVPTNQSLASFVGDDRWLSSVLPGSLVRYSTSILMQFRQPALTVPKFVEKRVPVELSAVRLQSSAVDNAAYFIVLAEIAPDQP